MVLWPCVKAIHFFKIKYKTKQSSISHLIYYDYPPTLPIFVQFLIIQPFAQVEKPSWIWISMLFLWTRKKGDNSGIWLNCQRVNLESCLGKNCQENEIALMDELGQSHIPANLHSD